MNGYFRKVFPSNCRYLDIFRRYDDGLYKKRGKKNGEGARATVVVGGDDGDGDYNIYTVEG